MKNKLTKYTRNPRFKTCGAIALGLIYIVAAGIALADGNSPVNVINNLSTFMFGVIKAIGAILLGFGIVQIGLSLKSHDAAQRANGFMTLAGGVIIMFAKESASVAHRNRPGQGLV